MHADPPRSAVDIAFIVEQTVARLLPALRESVNDDELPSASAIREAERVTAYKECEQKVIKMRTEILEGVAATEVELEQALREFRENIEAMKRAKRTHGFLNRIFARTKKINYRP